MGILTITLNPAFDLETRTAHLQPGEKLRCSQPTRDPGGGGINVARAIAQMGGEATALVAAGGGAGDLLMAMLAERNVPAERLPAAGEMRQNLSVIETETGAQYRFIFPGPTWGSADVAAVGDALERRVSDGDWVVLSGSLPPGMAPHEMTALIRAMAQQGARVIADTSGAALSALAAGPATGLEVLRMDRDEAEGLNGGTVHSAEESAAQAARLVAAGVARVVIIARGAEGSVLAAADGRWFAPAADVPVVSRTGAGDSFVAGSVMALAAGLALPEVLQHGCAAASAAVTTPATELCESETVTALLPQSQARPI